MSLYFYLQCCAVSILIIFACLKCNLYVLCYSVIGTSSLRRVAQLKRRYPHLEYKPIVSFTNAAHTVVISTFFWLNHAECLLSYDLCKLPLTLAIESCLSFFNEKVTGNKSDY